MKLGSLGSALTASTGAGVGATLEALAEERRAEAAAEMDELRGVSASAGAKVRGGRDSGLARSTSVVNLGSVQPRTGPDRSLRDLVARCRA